MYTCAIFPVWCLLVVIISISTAQNVIVSHQIKTDPDLGPVIEISCTASGLPNGSTDLTVQWFLYSTLLSENTALMDGDPSRYTVSNDGLTLSLQNALKEDEGMYTCRVWYRLTPTSSKQFLERSDDVIVASFLPSLIYPVCSLSPDDTFIEGTVVQFQCTQGSSRPQAIMKITVQYTDGESIILHSSTGIRVSVSKETTEKYRDAVFLCNITSDTFPSANTQHSCTATLKTLLPMSTSILPSTENVTIQGTSQSQSTSELTTPGTTETFTSSEQTTTESTQKPSSRIPPTSWTTRIPSSDKPTMSLTSIKQTTLKQLMTIKSGTTEKETTHMPPSSAMPKFIALTQCKYNLASLVVPLIIALIAIILVILLSLKIIQLNKVIDEDLQDKESVSAINNGIEEDESDVYKNQRMTQI